MTDLDAFAECLVRVVRDRAVVACDRLCSDGVLGPQGERWRGAVAGSDAEMLRGLLPDVVDQVLFELLYAVDAGELPLAWQDSQGEFRLLRDLGQGEMAGWLAGSPGWRGRFSSERFNDYNAGLRLNVDWGEPDHT